MGSIEKRVQNGKVTWLARWRGPDGRQHKRSFAKRTAAERFLVDLQAKMLTGSYVDPAAGKVTVGEWAATWLAGQANLKPSTRLRYEGLLRVQVLPRWERMPLSAVSHADVDAWVAELKASGLSGSTVRQAHRVLSLMLSLAVRDGRLARNVADGVSLPRAAKPGKRFLTHEQVAALADAAGAHRLVVLTLAYTGLRWGELAALKVGRVDLLRRRLTVAESVSELSGHVVFGTPKTHQVRSVPVPRSLVDELARLVAGKGPEELVFTASKGGVLRLSNFRRYTFDSAARSVGLEGLSPHELRHAAASLAVSAGANVKVVQQMLGHASAAMTLDVYAGLFGDDLDAVADAMDLARAGVPSVCPSAPVVDLDERRTSR